MRPALRDQHRRIAFRRIEQQRQKSRAKARIARDVGGADIAAALVAYVVSLAGLHDQIAERNRAQQIRDDQHQPWIVHAEPFTNGKARNFLYSAPARLQNAFK